MSERVGHFEDESGRADYRRHHEAAMALLPTPAATPRIETELGTVQVYEWPGPAGAPRTPLLLAPGRSAGVGMWAQNLPAFIATHRVLAFDALGDAGLSVQTKAMSTFDEQAAWIRPVVDALAPGGVHVVGHSFGGATAATFATSHPDKVRSLALLEPVFTFARAPVRSLVLASIAIFPLLPRRLRQRALGRLGGADFDTHADDPVAQMIAAGVEHFTAALPTPKVLTDAQLAALTMPAYVAFAERQSLAGGRAALARAALLPNGTAQVWAGTTHSLPMQVAAELAEVLRAFWAPVDAS